MHIYKMSSCIDNQLIKINLQIEEICYQINEASINGSSSALLDMISIYRSLLNSKERLVHKRMKLMEK